MAQCIEMHPTHSLTIFGVTVRNYYNSLLQTFPQLGDPFCTLSLVSSSDVDGLKAVLLAGMCDLQRDHMISTEQHCDINVYGFNMCVNDLKQLCPLSHTQH